MNNKFQYTKTEGQGWLVEKPERELPNSEWEANEVFTLRRFKYDYPDPKKEMELGKDFEVKMGSYNVSYNYATSKTIVWERAIPITQRTYSEQEMQEKDLIIQGIEEGAENWKAEYDNCRAILQLLVELKRIKDTKGKTEFYEKNQPITWEAAKKFLEKYTHIDY